MMASKSIQSSADSTSGSLKFECGICLKEFSTPWCLQIHIKTHTEEAYSCDECGMTFTRFLELFNHLNLHIVGPELQEDVAASGDSNDVMDKGTNNSTPDLICKKCGKSFGSDKVMKLHLRRHDQMLYNCQVCGLKFASVNVFKVHWKASSDHQSVLGYKIDTITRKRKEQMHGGSSLTDFRFISRKWKRGEERHVELKGTGKHRCRVCKMSLPHDIKLRRAHIRKHLFVKLNKSFYHAWKYMKGPIKTLNGIGSGGSPSTLTQRQSDPHMSDFGGFDSVIVSAGNCQKTQHVSKWKSNMSKNNRSRKKKCEICCEKLKCMKDLREHFQIKHGESKSYKDLKSFSCEAKKSMSPWFPCATCGEKLRGKKKLYEHTQLAHNGRHPMKNISKKVKHCGNIVEDKKRLLKSDQSISLGIKHGPTGPWFQCSTCGKILKGKNNLHDHCQKLHCVSGSSEVMPTKPRETHVPPEETKHQWRKCCKKQTCAWYVCNHCDERFKGKQRIKHHVLSCHTVAENIQSNDPQPLPPWNPVTHSPHCSWFICRLCNKRTLGKKRMSQHFAICKGDKTPSGNTTPSFGSSGNVCSLTSNEKPCTTNPSVAAIADTCSNSGVTKIDLASNQPEIVKCQSGPWFKCLLCNKLLRGKTQVKMHNHSEEDVTVTKPKSHHWAKSAFISESGIHFFRNATWYRCQECNDLMCGRFKAENHSHDTYAHNDNDSGEKLGRDTNSVAIDPSFVQKGSWYKCTLCRKVIRGMKNMKVHGHCRVPAEGSVVEPASDSSPIQKPTEGAVIETTNCSVTDLTEGSISKLTEDPCTELTKGLVTGLTKSSVINLSEESSTELTENLIREQTKGSVKELIKGSITELTQDPYTEIIKSSITKQTKSSTVTDKPEPTDKCGTPQIVDTKKSQALKADTPNGQKFFRNGCWYRCTVCMENLKGRKHFEAHCHYEKSSEKSHVMEEKDCAEPGGTLLQAFNAISKVSSDSTLDLSYDGTPTERHKKCKLCGNLYASESDLNAHMKSHPPHSIFACNACSKMFITKRDLNQHKKIKGQCRQALGSSPVDRCGENVEKTNGVGDLDRVFCPVMAVRTGCHKEQLPITKTISATHSTEQDCSDLNFVHAQPCVESKSSRPSLEDVLYTVCDEFPSDGDGGPKETCSSHFEEDMSRNGDGWSIFVEFDGRPPENSDDIPPLEFYGDSEGKVYGNSFVKGYEQSSMKSCNLSESYRNSDVFHSTYEPSFFNKRKAPLVSKFGDEFSLNMVGLYSGAETTSQISETISINHESLSCDPCSQGKSLEGSDESVTRLSVRDQYLQQGSAFVCKICSKQCSSRFSIIRHVKSHLMEQRFKCQTCGFVSSNYSNLKKHELNKHTFSPATAKTISQMVKKYMSTDGKVYRCDICSKTFAGKTHLRQHIHGHLVKQAKSEKHSSLFPVKKSSSATNSFTGTTKTHTSDCRLPLSDSESQLSQMNDCELSESFPSQDIAVLRPSHHFSNLPPRGSSSCPQWVCLPQLAEDQHCLLKGEFVCQVCFKRFVSQLTAQEHVASHFNSNSTTCWRACEYNEDCLQILNLDPVCRVCGAVFESSKSLIEHEESHSELERLEVLKYLKCSDCGKLCRTHGLLQKHQTQHSYMNLKCPVCPAYFTNIVHLDLHVLKKRHFMCRCNQVFPDQFSLNIHARHCSLTMLYVR